MDSKFIKTGVCSIVLGNYHYSDYINHIPNKMLKITKIMKCHNEFKNLGLIRRIPNYSNYYTLPDEEQYVLKPEDNFYKFLKILVQDEKMKIFNGNLIYNYVDYAGNKELLDTFIDLIDLKDNKFWSSYKKIIEFSKLIMEGLNYLHQNKICHLDIKPENIMVNTYIRKFKIIDFGFSSVEPFHDYIENIRGTPGYFPKIYKNEKPNDWLPKIKANDFTIQPIPHKIDRTLVYKIDSYCLGRVLYFLKTIYQNNLSLNCFNFERNRKNKIENIINSLIENDVYKRLTIGQCLKLYF